MPFGCAISWQRVCPECIGTVRDQRDHCEDQTSGLERLQRPLDCSQANWLHWPRYSESQFDCAFGVIGMRTDDGHGCANVNDGANGSVKNY